MLKHLKSNRFVKDVTVLTSGTVLAQLISLLASLILVRLYTPIDFGLFAILLAIVGIVSPAVCGRYEIAMVLPKNKEDALHLFGIAIVFALFVSVLFLAVICVQKDKILTLLNAQNLGNWIFLAPLLLLMRGIFSVSSYYANRTGAYRNLANSIIVRSVFVVIVSVFLGLLNFGFIGLFSGYLIGTIIACAFLLHSQHPEVALKSIYWSPRKWILFKRYFDFPAYNASTALLIGANASIPILFIGHYFSESDVGHYALFMQVASLPLAFLSNAVSQVNLKTVVGLVNSGERIIPFVLRVTLSLSLIIALPAVILVVFGPQIFAFLFGDTWRVAGEFMQIMMPAVAIRFVVSTLSSTLGGTKNNHYGAAWKIIAFVSTLCVFIIFAPTGDIILLLKINMLKDIAIYLLYYVLICKAALNPKNFSDS